MIKTEIRPTEQHTVICALYKFVNLNDYRSLRSKCLAELNKNGLRGTLLLAQEGINGTIAGSDEGIERFLEWLCDDRRFDNLEYKLSYYIEPPFYRTKVKLKQEIVTLGVDGIDPINEVGIYVKADDWNQLINDPEITLIDTRNEYEYEIGTFKNAINPHTRTFRDFPNYVKRHLNPTKHKKVAMFCTGGIRCEKASAYMKQQGFNEVYHLQGGILNYLESVDPDDSLWNGECFMFDNRVTVNHKLQKGRYDQCHACRYPITEKQKQSEHYIPGISCSRCYDKLTDQQVVRFSERQKQVELAKQRSEIHIGDASVEFARQHRQQKRVRKQQQTVQQH